jgi:crossover junction endodeoxyribonuclease RuvC
MTNFYYRFYTPKGAALLAQLPFRVGHIRMPTMQHRGKKLVDGKQMIEFLLRWDVDVMVCEWVHAMPRQGVTSAFSFGRSTGAVEALGLFWAGRAEWVSPQVWKKHYGLSKDKQASLDLAQQKFGDDFVWRKKADDGIAEAALIAHWFLDKHI